MRSPERDEPETTKDGASAGENMEISQLDSGGEEELDIEDVEDDLDDSDLNLLIALAELDAEAAEAYRIAAEYTDRVHFRTKLEEFRADHLRHIETFNRLLAEAGVPGTSTELDEDSSALTMLAASMGTMGARSTLLVMIANEQLTNAAYQAATELPFEEDVMRILEHHLADERRHHQWLCEQEPRVHDDELDLDADA